MSDIYIINAAGSPAVLSSGDVDSIFIPEGAREIDADEFAKVVAEAESAEKKRIEAYEAEAAKIIAEKTEAGMKLAQEAYDAAVKAGLPEIVAVGVARNYLSSFEAPSAEVKK